MFKLKTQLDIANNLFWVQKFLRLGRPEGIGPPSVNLGPPNISGSTRARKLKLKTKFDIVNYRKTSDRSPRLLLVQFTLTPGLYPGPGV